MLADMSRASVGDYFFKVNSNALLIVGLIIVLVGVIGQIWTMKKEGEVTK